MSPARLVRYGLAAGAAILGGWTCILLLGAGPEVYVPIQVVVILVMMEE